VNDTAFERYRYSPSKPVTIGRLIGGLAVVLAMWVLATMVLIVPAALYFGGDLDALTNSAGGTLAMFGTFAGIWLGVWVATRAVHKEPFGNVLGWAGKVSRSDFAKAFAVIVITSALSEILIYLIRPDLVRSSIPLSEWLIYLLPVAFLCFVQTAGEELLFRGYLLRNLANRFRSPWVWALIPGLIFTCMHLSPGMRVSEAAMVLISIGSLTVLLTVLVYATGNLGAAFGVHMANNFLSFVLISHQSGFSRFSLFNGLAIDSPAITDAEMTLIVLTALVCVGLSCVLLLHRRSPFKVGISVTKDELPDGLKAA
jgi:membrane protease YdiL (CAAX protease family)